MSSRPIRRQIGFRPRADVLPNRDGLAEASEYPDVEPNVRYAVELGSFEDVGVRALEAGLREPHTLLVIDELGKMEFLSATFVALLEQAFQSPNPLLGTVLYRPHPVADRFRQAPGVELLQVTSQNRDALPVELARRLSAVVVRPTRR